MLAAIAKRFIAQRFPRDVAGAEHGRIGPDFPQLHGEVQGQLPTLLDQRIEVEAVRADGTRLPVELTITRIDVPGPPVFTGHLRDITDRLANEAELRASRARIVEAADAARRRIERDLHDGAQQQLVGLAVNLRGAKSRLAKGDTATAEELLESAMLIYLQGLGFPQKA